MRITNCQLSHPNEMTNEKLHLIIYDHTGECTHVGWYFYSSDFYERFYCCWKFDFFYTVEFTTQKFKWAQNNFASFTPCTVKEFTCVKPFNKTKANSAYVLFAVFYSHTCSFFFTFDFAAIDV